MFEVDSQAKRRSLQAAIVILGLVVRIVAVAVWNENLSQDRDSYLALALGLSEGRGYSSPGTTQPTAYRPPLYPMILALGSGAGSERYVAILNVLLGTATVGLTFLLARRLNLAVSAAGLAAGIVAIDPLLVRYTSFPMTETLSTFLTTGLLLWTVRLIQAGDHQSKSALLIAGLLFGLNVLCRPTLWAFGALMVIYLFFPDGRSRSQHTGTPNGTRPMARRLLHAWPVALGILACVLPWTARNWNRLGQPIVTTTHGGYTLLLGNNPAFYREVVAQPLGTVWDGSHGPGQAVWAESINVELQRAGLDAEVARDRWMSRRARRNMAKEPVLFARACLLRLIRFWNIMPSGEAAGAVPPLIRWGVGGFYSLLLPLAAVGAVLSLRRRDSRMLPLLLLIASFTLVHLFYWSNVRMRAPLMPAVAIMAASTLVRSRGATSIAPDDPAR